MRWRWLLILIPLLLGVLLATLLNNSEIQNPLFRILISLSSLLLITAVLTTLVLFAFVAFWRYLEVRHRAQIAALETRAAEDRRRFLRRLDHELKNPLMAIRAGLANFANAPTAASRKSALATVEAQTVRLSRLTTDLRKIAELESRPLELSQIDLEQLLQEVIELAREQPQAFEREIRLTLSQVPWPLPAISGDWDLIFLATYNLLDNALKFSQPGDTIEVRGGKITAMCIWRLPIRVLGLERRSYPTYGRSSTEGIADGRFRVAALDWHSCVRSPNAMVGRWPLPAERVAEPWPQYSCLLKHPQADN